MGSPREEGGEAQLEVSRKWGQCRAAGGAQPSTPLWQLVWRVPRNCKRPVCVCVCVCVCIGGGFILTVHIKGYGAVSP